MNDVLIRISHCIKLQIIRQDTIMHIWNYN